MRESLCASASWRSPSLRPSRTSSRMSFACRAGLSKDRLKRVHPAHSVVVATKHLAAVVPACFWQASTHMQIATVQGERSFFCEMKSDVCLKHRVNHEQLIRSRAAISTVGVLSGHGFRDRAGSKIARRTPQRGLHIRNREHASRDSHRLN